MVKVSIVTTCFNSASTIEETIESIHSNRGDFELEHIVTDAGSTDGTLDIVRRHPQIKLFETPGLNQSQGINYGLKKSTGSIVAFLNADDLYYPYTIQRVVDAFRTSPESMWVTGYCPIIDEHGAEQSRWISSYKNFFIRNYSYFWLLVENYICQPSVFLRREALEKYGYFSEVENLCMDYEYWLRIGKDHKPQVIKEKIAKFRRMNTTKSNTQFEKQFKDDKRIGTQYAYESGHVFAAVLKQLSYYRTIILYRRLYRVR